MKNHQHCLEKVKPNFKHKLVLGLVLTPKEYMYTLNESGDLLA